MEHIDYLIERGYEVVLRETYRDHELVALTKFYPAGTRNSEDYTDLSTGIDGRFFMPSRAARRGVEGGSVEEARTFLRQTVDEWVADKEILPKLLPLVQAIRDRDSVEALAELSGEPQVDQVVYVFAMGYWRRGLVTRKTRTKVEVAYTTASSNGRVFRKMASQLLLDGHV